MKTTAITGKLLAIALVLGWFQATLADPPEGKPPGDKPPRGFQMCDLNVDIEVHADHRCRVELMEVNDALLAADSVEGRNLESLQSKVCLADQKLHIEKWSDAAQKVTDISVTVNSKKKIDTGEATAISTIAVAVAMDIVNFSCDTD